MSKKNTNDNIPDIVSQLTAQLEPCKPLAHPFMRMLPWVLAAALYVFVLSVFVIGLRDDWYAMLMHDINFQIDMGLAFFLFISSGFVLGWVNLPDMRQQEWVMIIPIVALVLFLGNVVYRFVTMDAGEPIFDMMCFPKSAALTIVPLGYLIAILRNGCSSCHRLSAFFSILAVSSLGWIGLRMTSMNDHVTQSFFIEFVPFILLGMLIGILSGKLFRW